jgi:hypothetical protein
MTEPQFPDRGRHGQPGSPFATLGLPASAEVTDEDVRAAWRRTAAATHPDRRDGGDPPRFAAASAAYMALRTRFGRGEALAELARGGGDSHPAVISPPREAPLARQAAAGAAVARAGVPADLPRSGLPYQARGGGRLLTRALTRVRRGRPAVLTVRVLIVAAIGLGSAALVGSAPATPALITGALTWLLLTARHDLGPP